MDSATSLQGASDRVEAFHQKVRAPAPRRVGQREPIARNEAVGTTELRRAGDILVDISARLKTVFTMTDDVRLLRAELILEEAGEVLLALSGRAEADLLDGLVDAIYVLLGTAITYDLPIDAGFDEVHRSNMTKGAAAATHSGDRGKADGFIPADIQSVINRHRAEGVAS